MEAAKIVFPSHTAPLDVHFTLEGMTTYVSFHGLWNRSPPEGYRIGRVEFGAVGQPVKSLSRSKDAAEIIMASKDLSMCPNACFRPVGLTTDSKGRVLMSSDQSNELYIKYTPESNTHESYISRSGGA